MQRAPTCEHCQRNYELKDFQPIGTKIPLLLPCGHTFCEGCLVKAAKNKSQLQCFSCEEEFQLHPAGHQGVKQFVPNIYLLGLLLYNRRIALESTSSSLPFSLNGPISSFSGMGLMMKQKNLFPGKFSEDAKEAESKSQQEQSSRDILLCEECSLRPASCHCKMCQNVSFCEGCFRAVHAASKLLSKHCPLPLEYSSDAVLTCGEHKGRALEFYDKEMKEAVCAMCIIHEKCKGHQIVPISEMPDDSDSKLEELFTKAEQTLSWLQHSSKTLVNALPEEIFECNNLYTEIHTKFTACHTLLLKRQIELNMEAAEKLSTTGTINNMLQEVTDKIDEVSTTIKNFNMVKNNKNLMKMKNNEFLEKFESICELPSIIERLEETENSEISYTIPDVTAEALESFGSINVKKGKKFVLKKGSDYSAEQLLEVTSKLQSDSERSMQVVRSNEILDEEDGQQKKSKLSNLLLGGGTYDLVYVTHPGNPNDFKVQRYADKERLEVLMAALNKYCRQATTSEAFVYKAEEGQLVCAQFTADNLWYRARVINTSSPSYPGKLPTWHNGYPIHVFYIDYGNYEWLPLSRLRQLKPEFLEIPEMAIPCSLMDIVPPYKEIVWPKSSINAFNSLTSDRPLLMNIRKRMAGKLYVDLRKPEDDEPTAIDDDRPVSVRDALVFLEVAVFVSPASQPNLDAHRSLRTYLPPIEMEKGIFYDITVTHAENPHHLYIQRLDSIIQSEQKHLTKLYSGRNKKTWKVGWPYRNLVVGARFTIDQTWYRGVIRNVNRDETVEVEYIDYGNKETLSFDDIRKLPEMFLKVPIQCQTVRLYGIDKQDGEENWSEMSNLLLKEKFIDRLFVAVVKGFDDTNIPMVELIDTMSDDDVNMNKFLVEHGAVKDTVGWKSELVVESNEIVHDASNEDLLDVEEEIIDHAQDDDKGKNLSVVQYMKAKCPKMENVSVTGVFVDEHANIYLHVNNEEDTSLSDIMQHLNGEASFHEALTSTSQLVVGQACVGKYPLDQLWYRVEVVKILDEKNVLIYFIDFGNQEIIECDGIVAQALFIDIPSQCLKTRLHGVVEDAARPNYGWSLNAREFINEKVVNESNIFFNLKVDKDGLYEGDILFSDGSSLASILSNENLIELYTSESTLCVIESTPYAPESTPCAPESTPLPLDSSYFEDDTDEPEETTLYPTDYISPTDGFFKTCDSPIDVTVTQVNRPDLLYVQIADELALNQLEEVSEEINSDGYVDDLPSLQNPAQGMACIAQYSEDEVYYRGRIQKLDKEIGTADILFVDYGNTEIVPIPSLKPIGVHLLDLPAMAVLARLEDVKPPLLQKPKESYPPESFVDGTEWLVEHVKKFYDIVADKKMSAIIKESSSQPVTIELCDATGLSENGGGELVSVKVLMQKQGIAA